MNGGAMSGRTANLVAIAAAAMLFAGWYGGLYAGGTASILVLGWIGVPVVLAVGGFVVGFAPTRFPGLGWRLMIAEWVPFAAVLVLTITSGSDCVGESCGVEEQLRTALLTACLGETLFVNGALVVGMLVHSAVSAP